MRIHILSTGGTIEKTYNEIVGGIENRLSLVKTRLLKPLRLPDTQVEVYEVMAKDSLDMTAEDRTLISDQAEKLSHFGEPIIILHGTDTLEKTAEKTYERIKTPHAPIIFTGAMRPAGFEDSDAQQNFTEALFAAKILPPGVYVTFHGQLFHVPNVRKNKERGTFEAK